jgi:gliding motility-associated protein GldE
LDPEPTSLLVFQPVDNSFLAIGCVVFIVLLICSALISAAEVALFSLTQTQIDKGLEQKSKSFQSISKLLEKPKKLSATLLIASNFLNVGIVILFAYLGEFFFSGITSSWLRFLIEVVVAASIILLFAKIIPKIYGSSHRVTFSKFMIRPIQVLDVVLSPLSQPMRHFNIGVHNKLGKQKSNINVDQLSHALELTDENDTTQEEHKILKGIVSFGNTDTKQVMRPRIDIFGLEIEEPFAQIIPQIINNGYSRIPIYKDTIDTVVGILYVKDLIPHIDKKEFDWTGLIREPFFVPENKKLDDLMLEFQNKKVHLAVVVDEYGGTSGLVSLEDVIEEIVGDISDEFDDDDLLFTKIDDNNYSFDGKTPLKDFYKIIGLEDESGFENHKGEAETVAGFVLEISGIFPKRNSKINFKNYVFTVEALDRKRIKQVKLTIT